MPHHEHRGDTIAERDPPNYPTEWTSEQCLTAYWYTNGHHITTNSTTSWHGILNAAERTAERRHNKIVTLTASPQLTPTFDDEVPF